MSNYQIDETEVSRALKLIAPPVTELRVMNATVAGERRTGGTFSGYFDSDHHAELIAELRRVQNASAAYFIFNELKPELLARRCNRAEIIGDRTPVTGDKDILRRRFLPVDVDSVRPAGVSATDAERTAAYEMVIDIDAHLWEKGYPPGIIADSSNGAHLLIPLDLPANDHGFVKRLLTELAARFNTDKATVDTSVHNASRIWKLYGCESRKGDNCPALGRVWRLSKILTECQELPHDA
ncbi:MAG: hypothetical protein ACKVP0_05630 [Pirellulaceae bacterium]